MPILDHRYSQHDERNRAFGIAAAVSEPADKPVFWTGGPVLDQGDQGHCGGFALAGEAAASPIRVQHVDNDYGHRAYYVAKDRHFDPFGREDGTTTNAMMRVGQVLGLFTSYRWAFSMEDLRRNIKLGPFLLGVPWLTGMMQPDSLGFIKATGVEEGGHLVVVTGWSPDYRRRGPHFRIRQSWGHDHGLNGNVYLPEEDMGIIYLDRRGEAGVPVNRTMPVAA